MRKKARKIFNYLFTAVKSDILSRAPALFSVLEIKPTSCNAMITNRCNLKCIMCRQWKETPEKELSKTEWERIILDLKANGIYNMHFTGGEPLLRKDLTELVSYCAKNGFTVGLTTNGILLEKRLLDGLINAGLRSMAISIDALGKRYEEIRGSSDSFVKVKEAASLISEAGRKGKIDAYINYTLMSDTIDEFEGVKRLADELELPVGICLLDKNSRIFDLDDNRERFWIREGADLTKLKGLLAWLKEEMIRKPRSLILNFPAIEFIGAYFKNPRQEHIPCAISQDRIFIDPYGNLFGGCLSMGMLGNIRRASFARLSGEEGYRRSKKNMFYKRCAGCSCGYLFNIRHRFDLILKDALERIKHNIFGR